MAVDDRVDLGMRSKLISIAASYCLGSTLFSRYVWFDTN
jgi:hypothetical protein